MVALFALSVLLDYLNLEVPLAAQFLIVVLLVAFYVVPWLVAVVRNFAAGYRRSDNES